MGFEHQGATLGSRGQLRNAARIVANLAQNMLEKFTWLRPDGTIAIISSCSNDIWGIPGVFQLNDERMHNACVYV
jgi:hypothetical protein